MALVPVELHFITGYHYALRRHFMTAFYPVIVDGPPEAGRPLERETFEEEFRSQESGVRRREFPRSQHLNPNSTTASL